MMLREDLRRPRLKVTKSIGKLHSSKSTGIASQNAIEYCLMMSQSMLVHALQG